MILSIWETWELCCLVSPKWDGKSGNTFLETTFVLFCFVFYWASKHPYKTKGWHLCPFRFWVAAAPLAGSRGSRSPGQREGCGSGWGCGARSAPKADQSCGVLGLPVKVRGKPVAESTVHNVGGRERSADELHGNPCSGWELLWLCLTESIEEFQCRGQNAILKI